MLEHEAAAESAGSSAIVSDARETFLSGRTPTRAMITGGVCSAYGLSTWGELFTPRQLVALTTFSDLAIEVVERIRRDAQASELPADQTGIGYGGNGPSAYAEALAVYLAFAVEKMIDRSCSLCGWDQSRDSIRGTFGRQAFTMTWDFAESNPAADGAGSLESGIDQIARVLENLGLAMRSGTALQVAAQDQLISKDRFVSTDPPYYDNIAYAVLSEFFYFWTRRALRGVFPDLLATISVPKEEELVASPHRHGSKHAAEAFFLDGMTQAIRNLAQHAHPASPVTIYYAFKQADTEAEGTNSTGWETFLAAVIEAGFVITGTWPMRTELGNRMIGTDANALASSIILVCRPRSSEVGSISRRQFVRMLNDALPPALDAMTRADEGEHSPVAPVDLSQAIIGPGMAIFSRYDAVLEADGTPMSVKTALQLINRFLAEDDFDADTQFCLSWFEQHGWEAGKFGEADTLARAKGTSVDGVKQAGVAEAGGGSVRLLRWKEYAADWDPSSDVRLPVWEALHQLIRAYNTKGDAGAAKVLAQTASKAEAMRQLAYRLYTVCERKGRADDARAYNEVVTGWTGIETAASKESAAVQGQLFEN
jgi:putative DNA methylase